MNFDQLAQNSYNASKALQAQYDQNANNATNQYNQSVTGANNAQNDLSNFTKNMVSGTDMYGQQLQQANANSGYNVNDLNNAQNQVSTIQGIMGGLPRAIQASNANYGATAGDVAGQYATTGANLNQSLNLANTNAQNQIQKMQGGLAGAQAATTAGLQGQEQKRQGYATTAANAAVVMQQSEATMRDLIAAQQANGRLTAEQQQIFQQAKELQAKASADYAQAQASLASAANLNQQTQYNREQHDKMLNAPAPIVNQATGPSTPTRVAANGSYDDQYGSHASQAELDQMGNNGGNDFWGGLMSHFRLFG